MEKLRMGGTWAVVANKDEARRIVPSPPSVVVISTLVVRRLLSDVV